MNFSAKVSQEAPNVLKLQNKVCTENVFIKRVCSELHIALHTKMHNFPFSHWCTAIRVMFRICFWFSKHLKCFEVGFNFILNHKEKNQEIVHFQSQVNFSLRSPNALALSFFLHMEPKLPCKQMNVQKSSADRKTTWIVMCFECSKIKFKT